MKKKNKGIAILLGICCVLGVVCVVEYTMLKYEKGHMGQTGENSKATEWVGNKGNTADFTDGVSKHGALSVDGVDLVDKDGKPFQLKGVSSHGILWYPDFAGCLPVAETKKYGANVFRIAAYADDESGGYVQRPEETLRYVRSSIEAVLANDMYAIVDWHVLNDGNPLTNKEKAKEFFAQIAGQYGDEPGIIYEICNEPNGDTTWEDITAYANEVIPLIRGYAPNALILVGTPEYSYAITKVQGAMLPYENVMYSYHFYAGQYDDSYSNMLEACRSQGVPIFVSEWGMNISAGEPGSVLAQGQEFVTYLNKEKISWVAWSLSNKNEAFSLLSPECNTYSGWQEEDFTDIGKIVFQMLGDDK